MTRQLVGLIRGSLNPLAERRLYFKVQVGILRFLYILGTKDHRLSLRWKFSSDLKKYHSMARTENDALRRVFLENSSRYLAVSSPSTSAHLMAERLALNIDDGRAATKDLYDYICVACGTLMIIGWNAVTRQSQQRTTSKTRKCERRGRHNNFAQTCQVCHRETITVLHFEKDATKTATKTARPKSKASIPPTQATENPLNVSKGAEKTSSKQRAKTRKEKSGLQALLSKSRQIAASSSTLSLMDLMKA